MISVVAASFSLGVTLLVFLVAVVLSSKKKLECLSPSDDFFTARFTEGWPRIGLSLFSGAMGSWCLTVVPEMAIFGGLYTVIGYAIACVAPWAIFVFLGPILRSRMGHRGFTMLEFVKERYGRSVELILGISSCLYMWVVLVSELITIGSCFESIAPGFHPVGATVSVAIVTLVYSFIGGLRASIFTDMIQGVMSLVLIVCCYTAIFIDVTPNITPESRSSGFNWDSEGVVTAFTLILSCTIVEQLNQGSWQRVFAASTDRDVRLGFLFACCLTVPSMIVFGSAGLLAKAASLSGYIPPVEELTNRSIFLLLAHLPAVFIVFFAILATALVASTVDSVQAAILAVAAGEIEQQNLCSSRWALVICFIATVPAVFLASFNPPAVITVMMFANIISTAIVPPMCLGISPRITTLGAISGVVLGLICIPSIGWWRMQSFVGGLRWFEFPNGYNWECLLTFIIVPTVSAGIAFLVSQLECHLKPEKFETQVFRLTEMQRKNDIALIAKSQSHSSEETGKIHCPNNPAVNK